MSFKPCFEPNVSVRFVTGYCWERITVEGSFMLAHEAQSLTKASVFGRFREECQAMRAAGIDRLQVALPGIAVLSMSVRPPFPNGVERRP